MKKLLVFLIAFLSFSIYAKADIACLGNVGGLGLFPSTTDAQAINLVFKVKSAAAIATELNTANNNNYDPATFTSIQMPYGVDMTSTSGITLYVLNKPENNNISITYKSADGSIVQTITPNNANVEDYDNDPNDDTQGTTSYIVYSFDNYLANPLNTQYSFNQDIILGTFTFSGGPATPQSLFMQSGGYFSFDDGGQNATQPQFIINTTNGAINSNDLNCTVDMASGIMLNSRHDQELTNTILPVSFGPVSATMVNNMLNVKWSTLTETNNDHFNIEASTDGKNFTKIGSVISKADANGNSATVLNYSFTKNNVNIPMAAASLAVIGFAGLLMVRRKNKMAVLALAIGFMGTLVSCSKQNDAAVNNAGTKVMVRIAQVDKDGKTTYSKTIDAVNE